MSQVPAHIPIVTWSWVVSGIDGYLGPLWDYAAYADRIPPLDLPVRSGKGKGKGKQRDLPDASANLSRISCVLRVLPFIKFINCACNSAFTQDKPQRIHDSEDDEPAEKPGHQAGPLMSPPSSPRHMTSSSRVKTEAPDDPLAEFYAQARADRDSAVRSNIRLTRSSFKFSIHTVGSSWRGR
jgi:hypothetical protein